jgi:hypothetical protein
VSRESVAGNIRELAGGRLPVCRGLKAAADAQQARRASCAPTTLVDPKSSVLIDHVEGRTFSGKIKEVLGAASQPRISLTLNPAYAC